MQGKHPSCSGLSPHFCAEAGSVPHRSPGRVEGNRGQLVTPPLVPFLLPHLLRQPPSVLLPCPGHDHVGVNPGCKAGVPGPPSPSILAPNPVSWPPKAAYLRSRRGGGAQDPWEGQGTWPCGFPFWNVQDRKHSSGSFHGAGLAGLRGLSTGFLGYPLGSTCLPSHCGHPGLVLAMGYGVWP